jgi:YVTN family beta-propeller protein
MTRPNLPLLLSLAAAALCPAALHSDDLDQLKVGLQPDGRIVTPTNQILKPAGKQVTFPGRPVDLALTDDGKTLVVKNMRELLFIDAGEGRIKGTLLTPAPLKAARPGFSVAGLLARGDRVYASDAASRIHVARRQEDGTYDWTDDDLELTKPAAGGAAFPAGLSPGPGKDELWAASSRGNEVQLIDAAGGKVKQSVGVGVAPYMICRIGDRLYVSNWGGDPPGADGPAGKTSGTPVRVDPTTGVANHGTVSVGGGGSDGWKQVKTMEVGLHPCGMAPSPDGRFLYVANAGSDTVSVIDAKTEKVVETISCRPEGRLPFGSGSNAVAVSPDGGALYVADGTNNCVAVVRLAAASSEGAGAGRPEKSAVAGLIPTGWYPGAVILSPDGKTLYVANVKGHGSLSQPRAAEKGKNSHDHLGSVSIIPVPDAEQLAAYTKEVNANNRLAYSLAGLEKPREDAKPVPLPQRHGEPSVFKHVIYVIKENRTYDQVLGDMKEGDGDPKLCLFDEEVTPNHHALARQFTLFDNFYCSGVLSADGHMWCNEAYVTDYLEKSFAGFTRSYPDDGNDALAYAPTGFLWDNALAHKKTLRNYGEYTSFTSEPKKAKWSDYYDDYVNKTNKVKVTATANSKGLEGRTHPAFPWWPPTMPDVYKARLFIDELKEFEKKGDLPNLLYVALPNNHTSGLSPDWPTPRAMVADNDLALGQLVEAVSKSKFWPETCIFVVEDDPQNGFDHVDGHRTVAFVISPYTKRKFVDHTAYNQTGMVKSIELILGLPAMTQLDLSATPMKNCFAAEADLTPYDCVANKIKLDEMNLKIDKLDGAAREWAEKSLALDFDDIDAADEDTLNRVLWFALRGTAPYPEEYVSKKPE